MYWIGHLVLLLGIAVSTAQQCGIPQFAPKHGNDRIVGGTEAAPHSWPWQVSIIIPSGEHHCGGSIINNQWILSAAHCFIRKTATDFFVRLGKHNIGYGEPGEIIVRIKKIIQHHSFTSSPFYHDISLLKIEPISFNDKLIPVCLAPPGSHLPVGTYTYVTGWGSDGVQRFSGPLKQTMVPIVDWTWCKDAHKDPVMPGTICTGFPHGGHNSCFGDSGGPLVVQHGKAWYLHGVVSWGPWTCGIKEEPAIYTKVADYRSWIQYVISTE